MSKIYLIQASGGSYDGCWDTPLSIFDSEEKAKEEVKRLEAELERIKNIPRPIHKNKKWINMTREEIALLRDWQHQQDAVSDYIGFHIFDLELNKQISYPNE